MSNVVTTTCKDCIWAEYKNSVQVGCKFNRIDKFIERGVDVQARIEDEPVGLTGIRRQHYVIERFCNRCRDQNWANQYDNPFCKTIEQSQIQYDIIVPIIQDISVSALKTLFSNLLDRDSEINPSSVHMVFPEGIVIAPYLTEFNDYFKDYCRVFYTQVKENDVLSMINHGVLKCRGQYYVIVEPNFKAELPTYWTKDLDDLVNEDLYPVIMMKPIEEGCMTGLTINTKVHNTFGGNSSKSIAEKIENLVEEQGVKDVIHSWEK